MGNHAHSLVVTGSLWWSPLQSLLSYSSKEQKPHTVKSEGHPLGLLLFQGDKLRGEGGGREGPTLSSNQMPPCILTDLQSCCFMMKVLTGSLLPGNLPSSFQIYVITQLQWMWYLVKMDNNIAVSIECHQVPHFLIDLWKLQSEWGFLGNSSINKPIFLLRRVLEWPVLDSSLGSILISL